jgi:hypothetical protein
VLDVSVSRARTSLDRLTVDLPHQGIDRGMGIEP